MEKEGREHQVVLYGFFFHETILYESCLGSLNNNFVMIFMEVFSKEMGQNSLALLGLFFKG
jgi:hypothetical protein